MKRFSARWPLVVVGVLLWLIAVLPAYYVVHQPLATESLPAPTLSSYDLVTGVLALCNRAADLLLLAATTVVTAAWGSRLLRSLGLAFDSQLEQWTVSAILGLGLLGSVVLLLGVVAALYRSVAYALLALLAAGAWPELHALLHWLRNVLRRHPGRIPWSGLYTGAIGILTLAAALLPPTGWDALVYHLEGPRLYVAAHRLIAVPDNFYLNWPAQVEMLFAWGLLLKGDILSQLLHWVFWPLIGLLLFALARRATGEPRVASWSLVLWAALPFAADLAGQAYIDLGLTAFVLAGIYALLRWTEGAGELWLLLAGLFAGLAMGSKYTAATWLLAFLLLALYHARRQDARPASWIVTRAGAVVVVACLPVVPWLVKNWVIAGNPVYPFLFGGAGWNEVREAWLTWPGQSYSHNPIDYLALPWLMTVIGRGGAAAFDATIGPLLLCLVPLVVLARGRPRWVNYTLGLAAFQFLAFAVIIYRTVYLAQTRLLLPAFPLLCLAGAYGLGCLPHWDRPSLRLSRVVVGMVLLILIANLLSALVDLASIRPLAPLLGLESRSDYEVRRLGAYAVAMAALDEELPAQARVLFFWEPRGYHAAREVQADPTLDNLSQLMQSHPDAAAAETALRSKGFSHILLYKAGLDFLRGPTPLPPTLMDFFRQPPSTESMYPIRGEELDFLDELTARCVEVWQLDAIYRLYRLTGSVP